APGSAGRMPHTSPTNSPPPPGAGPAPLARPRAARPRSPPKSPPAEIAPLPASPPQPMDHAAAFAAPTRIGSVTAATAADLDCSVCHKRPGDAWTDGVFHSAIGPAVPTDCTAGHDPAKADRPPGDPTTRSDSRAKAPSP